jgi:myosin-1
VGNWYHDVRETNCLIGRDTYKPRYTLAVGRAPFHAAKREDIYRKLKACDYTWPDLAKFANEITDDLRDIVSLLLVHEDERPTPDQIVAHPFFKLGYIPLELESGCTSRIPKWSKNRPPTASTIKRGYTDEWWTMCKASAVGEYEPGKAFGAYGSRRNKTVAKDCQKEIEAGKQPNIPFATDCVYVPFPARVQWPHQPTGGLSEISEEKESSSEGQALTETTGNERPNGRLPKVSRKEQTMPTLKENAEPVEEQPTRLRAVRKISNPGRVTAATAIAPAPLRVPRDSRTTTRARIVKETSKAAETGLPDLPPLRIAKTIVRASARPEPEPEPASQPASQLATTRSAPRIRTISAEMPATDPISVLARLHVFRDNLARALDRKPTKSRRDQPPHLPYVSKWVDYSRRYGIGYVLDDGSIGTLLTAEDQYPVTVAFATDGYAHLKKAGKNREQAKNVGLNFYTTVKKDRGLTRIEVLDKRRIEEVRTVWHKFGRYMCATIGEDDAPFRKDPTRVNFVKFYQRLGNVGVWGFDDGSFQVNFPDHTKLVLSSDAGTCRFLCLPLEATSMMGNSGTLPWKYVKARSILQASLQQLLYGSAEKEDSYKEQTEANLLRSKIEFIHHLVSEWCQQGGIGCLVEPRDHVWDGPQLEETKRLDWASVGRYGGDVFS